MEREAKVPQPSASSSSQRAAPDCMRQAQAMIGILKRQRPTSVLPPQGIRGRRQVGVETELPKVGSLSLVPSGKGDTTGEALNDSDQSVRSGQEDTSLAPFDTMGTVTDNLVHQNLAVGFGNRSASETDAQTDYEAKSVVTSLHSSLVQHKKSILPSVDNVHTAYSSMLDHKNYCKLSDQTGTGNVNNLDLNKRQDFQRSVAFNVSGSSANIQHFMVHPVSRSSLTGLSCATTTSVHSVSAPLLNSTAYNTQSNMGVETVEGSKLNLQSITQGSSFAPSGLASQSVSIGFAGQTAVSTQVPSSAPQVSVGTEDQRLLKGQGLTMKCNDGLKAVHYNDEFQEREHAAMQCESVLTSDLQTKIRSPKTTTGSSNATGKSSNSTSRKKNSNADLFFKVNKKLYQKLGKIGSGGSSEVYKVISSDCTIYALKMIKLKGRDYSTAYGFCQEIKYLNKLRGRNNIIQLVDYEVTDRTLLEEVSNSSMTARDGKIKEEGYIYVVLEFGEIDLAHMLSQQWKEMDNSNQKIDENWLRFYWQQMLLAVNTIHEERIVHSDLKPANFLLVRGSLKLIDFGIAKALLNDTTNIQRDAQVGTLNYMSPEAFMWNEEDTSGNTIKCGRPSDIWSLGCILYQMVYGRTPFSEHKNFWAKFKAITDRNHQIKYEPVSNPLLIDLMKKCLAWDRDNRWRIPQLLQHPFLMPPALSHSTPSRNDHCQLLMQMAEVYGSNPQVSSLCCRLRDLITNIDEARLT